MIITLQCREIQRVQADPRPDQTQWCRALGTTYTDQASFSSYQEGECN